MHLSISLALVDTISIVVFPKGHISVNNVGKLNVLVLCTMLYNCIKFCENISKSSELLRQQDFHCEICKGTWHNSIKNVGEITVLVLLRFVKISQSVSLSRHDFHSESMQINHMALKFEGVVG